MARAAKKPAKPRKPRACRKSEPPCVDPPAPPPDPKLTRELERAKARIADLEARLAAKPQPAAPPAALAAIANRPASADPLEANATLHELLVAACREVARDPNLTAVERLTHLRTTAAATAKLLPNTRLFEAEQLIKSDHAELAKKRERRASAKLQPRAR